MDINPNTNINKTDLTGTPTQSVLLTSVPLQVTKSFPQSESATQTTNAVTAGTVSSILNSCASQYPGTVSIATVADGGVNYYEVQFDATLFVTVSTSGGAVELLSKVVSVAGRLGKVSDIPTAPTAPAAPGLCAVDPVISAGGTTVDCKLQVDAFSMELGQITDVKVAIDPSVV